MKRGPFEVKSSKEIYSNPWIKVREDKIIRPGGEEGVFGVLEGISGSTIAALTDDNKIFLVKEYHYAQGKENFELPSGAIDKGETPLEAAQRELKEETGITAKKWTYLSYLDPMTVIVNAPNHMFLAEDLTEGQQENEEKELIKTEKVSFKEVLEMVLNGEITHSGSVVAILKTARLKGF